MVSRRAFAYLLLAFCCCLVGMISASVPENALPDSSGDAPLPATIPGAVAIVKRFQKKQLPATPASTSDSPGQGLTEDPLHCTLNSFTSGTENPVVAATSVVMHDPILTEPSSEWPSPVQGPDSPEPIALASADIFQEPDCIPEAFCVSDAEDTVSIVDQVAFPHHGDQTFADLSEKSFGEGFQSEVPNTDLSWSQVHSDELHSVVSGAERPALPYLQVSQPTTSAFSPLRRGPLFAASVEVIQSLDSSSGVGPRPPPKARPPALKHYTSRPKSLRVHSIRGVCARGLSPRLLLFGLRPLLFQDNPRLGLGLRSEAVMLLILRRYPDNLPLNKGRFLRLCPHALPRDLGFLCSRSLHPHLVRVVACQLSEVGRSRMLLLSRGPRRP